MVAACVRHGAQFSLVMTRNPAVERALAAIDEAAWTPVCYPGAVQHPDTGAWISDAEVAEIAYTAFASTPDPITARLVVRRVKDARYPTLCSRCGGINADWLKYYLAMSTTATAKTALYLRQSYAPNGDILAITRQREDVTRLCRARGWLDTAEYVDNDFSATNGKPRPAYQQMLDDIRTGKVTSVAVWDLDRLYRQPRELEDLIDLADEKGLLLATVTGDADLSTDNGRLYARIKGAVGKSEIERKAARQRRAARQKAENGLPHWTRAFGYLGDTHQLDPHTAPLVKQAYAALLAGSSLKDIARIFNDAGAHGLKNGKPWTPSTVSLFLRAPRNAGLRSPTARSSARAPGPRWWTNPLGGQHNPSSPHPAAQPVARVCAATD